MPVVDHEEKHYYICTKFDEHKPLTSRDIPTQGSSHFFIVGSKIDDSYQFLCAIEAFIYNTNDITYFYISKADASGIRVPKVQTKNLISRAIYFLLNRYSRVNIQSVITLFVRSQNQYIFPGSSSNPDKKVLDDHRLLEWWMSVLNSLSENNILKATIFIPGLDDKQHGPYISMARDSENSLPWKYDVPWGNMHSTENASMVIPKFPDDPKSRFLVNLSEDHQIVSCKTFWQLLAFRQECGEGRMVGFLSVTLGPSVNTKVQTDTLFESSTVSPDDYDTLFDKLENSDFSSQDVAKASAAAWIELSQSLIKDHQWGRPFLPALSSLPGNVSSDIHPSSLGKASKRNLTNDLTCLVRKKPKSNANIKET